MNNKSKHQDTADGIGKILKVMAWIRQRMYDFSTKLHVSVSKASNLIWKKLYQNCNCENANNSSFTN